MTTGKQYNDKFKSHLGDGGTKAWKYCGMTGGPWCCAEVSLVAGETNKKLFYGGRKCTYCPTAMAYDKAHYAQLPMMLAMPGDRIYFDWNNNGVPDHIGEVEYKVNTEKIVTIEGNTGSPARVRRRTRPKKYVLGIYRPLYVPTVELKKIQLETETADFSYKSIYCLQLALGIKANGIFTKDTVKALQRRAGTTADGDWRAKTSKAVQKLIGTTVDGEFGKQSVIAFKKWINKMNGTQSSTKDELTDPKEELTVPKNEPTVPTSTVSATPKADKLVATAKELAWAKGTATKKYAYATGKPTAKMKAAMQKRGYDSKKEYSDCGYCQNTIIYTALGITTKVLKGNKDAFPAVSGFEVVYKGKKIVSGVLKPGDIIRYKKKNGKQHVLMYIGNNDFVEGGRGVRFFVWKHFKYLSKAKFHKKNVKISTLEVLRVKE